MKVCIKLKQLAALQKIIAWSVVIMSARSGLEMPCIVFGCITGIMLNEFADVWYKLIYKYEQVIEKSA
mgnify:FL=1